MGAFGYTNTGGEGGVPSQMFRGEVNVNDEPIYEEVDRDSYVVPPSGQYTLKVTGFSEPKSDPIPKQYQRDGGPTEKEITSVELEIVSDKGKGKRFLWNFVAFTLGGTQSNPSHLLRIYRAGVMKGDDVPRGEQLFFDNLIGAEFIAYVKASDAKDDRGRPKYAKVSADTISVVSDEADPFDEDEEENAA